VTDSFLVVRAREEAPQMNVYINVTIKEGQKIQESWNEGIRFSID
jgi:hypothetical protein